MKKKGKKEKVIDIFEIKILLLKCSEKIEITYLNIYIGLYVFWKGNFIEIKHLLIFLLKQSDVGGKFPRKCDQFIGWEGSSQLAKNYFFERKLYHVVLKF